MRIYKFWLRPEIIYRFSSLKKEQDKNIEIIHTLTEKVIQQRKKEYQSRKQQQSETGESEEARWSVFLDSLLDARDENGVGLTDEDIKSEVITMMFAVSLIILS
ncbi:hypothetical protein ILUMI_17081 [Ignelater luminosus]|uniref:Cytochrome P450 n=1 Tax=Ignelater luminosus TaxID=2038154 RepID=A0A8K0G5D3_IGNLU|nr:hypothetical protein ILUMI_17081 [Ignelater luminosus]